MRSPEGKLISGMFRIYHIPLLKLLMRYNSETDRNKSAQYKMKSSHYKWLLLITENLFKKSYQFLKCTCVYLSKVRSAPAPCIGICNVANRNGFVRSLKFWTISKYIYFIQIAQYFGWERGCVRISLPYIFITNQPTRTWTAVKSITSRVNPILIPGAFPSKTEGGGGALLV